MFWVILENRVPLSSCHRKQQYDAQCNVLYYSKIEVLLRQGMLQVRCFESISVLETDNPFCYAIRFGQECMATLTHAW